MCYETELICHVLQWLADTCQYNTTLYCERGHSTFTGATGRHFKLLESLAEFTPLCLTGPGPTFRKSGPSFSLVHLEQFYLARLEIFKMQGKWTFVPWWNESLGLYCPEQCQSTFFFMTSPIRNNFFFHRLGVTLRAWIGWTSFSCWGNFLFLGQSYLCKTSAGHHWVRFCTHPLITVIWIKTYSLTPIWLVLWSQENIFDSAPSYPCCFPYSQMASKLQAVSYPTVLLILFFPLIVPKILLQNHKLLKKKITGKEMAWPAVSNQALHLHSRTHTLTKTHAHIWFQFQMPFLIYISPSILTHNSLFIPSKCSPAWPQSPRPNRITTCHHPN